MCSGGLTCPKRRCQTEASHAAAASSLIIDIHTHTTHLSDDSDLTPDDLIVAAKEAGLDGLCITEHDRFWSVEAVTRLSRRHDFPVFPGCEITTEEGHLLVYGLTEYRFGMHRTSFVRELADRGRRSGDPGPSVPEDALRGHGAGGRRVRGDAETGDEQPRRWAWWTGSMC